MIDVDAVHELCRAALAARRLGCRLTLVDPDPALLDLLELTGTVDLFEVHARPCSHRHSPSAALTGPRRYLR